MFKNLTIYRLDAFDMLGLSMNIEPLTTQLTTQAFKPCGPMEMESTGWTAPREQDGVLAHVCEWNILLALTTEKKILPGGVINRMAKERAEEIADQQGFMPGRKQMREIKERVTDELLPQALSAMSTVRVWIDRANGWLVIDTASASRADHVLKMLLKSIDKLPIECLNTLHSPLTSMTNWLAHDEAPGGFTIDRDAILRTTGEGRGTVKFSNLTLEAADIGRHIAAGKQCTQLAMTWADRISFVLTESMAIKRVTPLDTLKENAEALDDDERFDADFLLMSGNLNAMLRELVSALGGELPKEEQKVAV